MLPRRPHVDLELEKDKGGNVVGLGFPGYISLL